MENLQPYPSLRICLVHEDEEVRRQWHEWAARTRIRAESAESAYAANEIPADVFVFDLASVCAPWTLRHHLYAPIARLLSEHPGAEAFVGSCASRNLVEGVLEDIEEVIGRRPKFFEAVEGWVGLQAALEAADLWKYCQ